MPEAFATRTRAVRVSREALGPVPTDRTRARARFGRWIDARIADARAASWPHDRPLVVAFISDGQLLRRYDEDVTSAGLLHVRATATTRESHRMLYRHPARRLHPLRRR